MMATRDLSLVNMDPEMPLPYAAEGMLLSDFTAASIDAMVEAFVGSTLVHVEVRHLGGAAAVRSPDHGVLDCVEQPFFMFTFGLTGDPDSQSAVEGPSSGCWLRSRRGTAAGATWASARRAATRAWSSRPTPSTGSPRSRTRYDPTGIFQANHAIAPG